jgi:hypothetical protein
MYLLAGINKRAAKALIQNLGSKSYTSKTVGFLQY